MRTVIWMLCASLLLPATVALASGHGEEAAAHGTPAKKADSGHGKKEAQPGGHGKPAGHGAAKASQPRSSHVSDVEQILALIAGKEKKHDPLSYVEVDLGEFRLSHGDSEGDAIVLLKFHIFAVLDGEEQAKFDLARAGRRAARARRGAVGGSPRPNTSSLPRPRWKR